MISLKSFLTNLLQERQRELDALYPDNYRGAMFLDDVQSAERKVRIDLLRREIRDINTIIKLEHHHGISG